MRCFETTITKDDIVSMSNLLESGDIGFGEKVELFEKKYAEFSNKNFNIGLNSASSAAFCLFAYLHKRYGSCDVYTSSLGFISPVWAAKHFGHNIIFVDVDKNLQFDIQDYQNHRRIRCERYTDGGIKPVVMPVLYGGVSTIEGFNEFFSNSGYKEIIVVDAAHCIAPTIKSDYIFFSFHPIKPVAMGSGGVLATDDAEANNYIRRYRNFGREDIGDSYDIVDNGFNFYMNNLNATLGLSQLSTCFENVRIRKKHFEYLKDKINISVGSFIEHDHHSSYYLSTLVLKSISSTSLRHRLRDGGLCASFHYPFLHKTKLFSSAYSLSRIESLEDRIINLPIHQNLKKECLDDIINIVNS